VLSAKAIWYGYGLQPFDWLERVVACWKNSVKFIGRGLSVSSHGSAGD